MATVYLTHNLYPGNPQVVVVDFQKIVKIKGEPNTEFYRSRRGELYWHVVLYTSGVDSNGDSLGPFWYHTIGSETTLNDFINNKVNEIAGLIDWTRSSKVEDTFSAQDDRYAPYIYWSYPSDGQIGIPIDSTVSIRLREYLPATGIDISTLVFKIDGFTVNPDITGNKYDYVLSYKPAIGK